MPGRWHAAVRHYDSVMSTKPSGRLRWSGAGALIGAVAWAYKSLAILATGEQPDYWFELALAALGGSVLTLILAVRVRIAYRRKLTITLGWIAAVAGVLAGLVYIVQGDDGLFGPVSLVAVVSMVVALFTIGSEIDRRDLLPRYSFGPRLLAWLFVVSIPVGGLLSAIDERLLEIGLLGVVGGWVVLAMGTLTPPAP